MIPSAFRGTIEHLDGSRLSQHALASTLPGLDPCDFFLWGFIKSKVYSEQLPTIEELKERIKKVFQEHITVQICRQVMTGYQQRLQRCLENQGDKVETGA